MSVLDTTVRLSIGLEDGEDLLEDIKQALVCETYGFGTQNHRF